MLKVAPSPAARWRLTDDNTMSALLFVVMAALVCVTPAQNDTWWHLRSGREMWGSRSLLLTEQFSHTAYGSPLDNHWWLSQLAFYGVYAVGGPALLTLVAGSCAFAAVFGAWRLLRGSAELRLVLLAFLIVATAPEWSVRPQVISLALLVLTAHLIRTDRTLWLPALCVVWANAHAMVIMGVGMAGASAVESLVWSRTRRSRDLVVLVLCVLAPTLSPLGWKYWPRVLSTVSISRELRLQEYRAPLDAGDLPFWGALAALVLVAVWRRRHLAALRRADRVNLIGALGLGAAAFGAARNVAFFAVIAAPALAALVDEWRPARRRRVAEAPWPAYALVAALAVGSALFVAAKWRGGGAQLGWRPVSAGALAAVRGCSGPLFNELEDGGFVMWALPDRPVFVDSRMEAYPADLLRRVRRAQLSGEYRDLFRRYGVSCAMVTAGSTLDGALAGDAGMRLVFRDEGRAVFARRHADAPFAGDRQWPDAALRSGASAAQEERP